MEINTNFATCPIFLGKIQCRSV